MSPSELSWLRGCLFMFLGIAGGYGLNRCQNRQTNGGTSDVELRSIRVENEIATTSFHDAQSSSGDEEARMSPSNPSSPVGEAVVFTGSPSCPDRSRLLSKSLRRRPRSLWKPSPKTRKTSHFLEFGAKRKAPNFVRRETDYNTIDANRTSSPMSSTIVGLHRLPVDQDEALSPSHPVREVLMFSGTPSYPDRRRCRNDSCTRMNAPEKRTKRLSENFMAQDEAWNIGRPELTNMVVAESSSTSMASTTAGLLRPPRRHFVPRPAQKTPLVDHVQVSPLDGLRRRPGTVSRFPLGEVKTLNGIRYRPGRRKWFTEMRIPKSKNKVFGEFESELEFASAIDAAYFYYEKSHLINLLNSTPAMMAVLPPMPSSLDNGAKFLFVKDQAKRLARYARDNLAEVIDPSPDKINQ